mmetsp:Transcript_16185/g.42730  ORF Transcript_16185/g.42730 Transcript_16185/m.42730 type:complete len:308 (+) Transcript_16185:120-1043(+)
MRKSADEGVVGLLGPIHDLGIDRDVLGLAGVGLVLVEIEVRVGRVLLRVEGIVEVHILGLRRQPAQDGGDSGQLGAREVDISTLAQAVREVTRGGGDHLGLVRDPGLVAHAEGAARQLCARADPAVDAVKALFNELGLVHFRGRRDPELGRQLAVEAAEELARCAEMADVGHARADEDLLDFGGADLGQRLRVVRIVRAAEDGLRDRVQVDLEDLVILCPRIGLHEHRVRQPSLHCGDAALDRPHVAVALGDHPLEHGDVRGHVLDDGLLAELDGTTGGRSLGRRVGKLEGLLALQGVEALDLEDAA